MPYYLVDADVPKADSTTDQSQDSAIREGSTTTADGDFGSSSKLNNGMFFELVSIMLYLSWSMGLFYHEAPPRRETEKPPRMQKQRSQDRILSKQQKSSFDSDSKRENLSRGIHLPILVLPSSSSIYMMLS